MGEHMKLSQPAEKKLREMLNNLVEAKRNLPKEPQLGIAYIWPKSQAGSLDFSKLPPMGEIRSIGISIECLDLLEREDGLRYLDRNQIRNAVNALAEEVHNDQTGSYTSPKFVSDLIKNFTQQYVKDENDYEIAFVITGLEVDQTKQPLGDDIISRWTNEEVEEWKIKEKDSGYFIDHTIMTVAARGVNEDIALERGRLSMETNLGIMRACAGYSERISFLLTKRNPNRITQSLGDEKIPDMYEQQLYFHWNGDYALRGRGEETGPISQRVSSPIYSNVKMSGQLLNYVSETLNYLNEYFNEIVSRRYAPEFRRALEWIGSSVTRPAFDDKVVDLCTALECVLCSKSDGMKGEALTIRQMILAESIGSGPSFETPHVLYGLYEIRSSIVHGSANRICNQHNVVSLMTVALSVMVAVIHLSEKVGEPFTKSSKFISYLNSQRDLILKVRSELSADFLQGAQKAYHDRNIPPETKRMNDRLVKYIDDRMLQSSAESL